MRKDRVGSWWSDQAEMRIASEAPAVDWTCSPLLQELINWRASGEFGSSWMQWLKQVHARETLDSGLCVGCGTGLLERDAVDLGICKRMVGVDIAPGALRIAARLAGDRPIEYRPMDLENDTLDPDAFDIIFCPGTLHHICRLGFCLGQLYGALRDGGLLVLNEYCGPSRFQWTPKQLQLVMEIYALLPWKYRYNHLKSGTVSHPERPKICSMIYNDPSEAVRSGEMIEVVESYFDRLDRRDLGGTLLNPLMSGILENFDEREPADTVFLSAVAALEEVLMRAGVVPSDFLLDVYRKKDNPPERGLANQERERSGLIESQETSISESHREYLRVEAVAESARMELVEARAEGGALGADVCRLQEENARLKADLLVFRIAGWFRRARGSLGRPAGRGEQQPDERGDAAGPAPVQGRILEVTGVSPALSTAVRRYTEKAPLGGTMYWLCWLKDVAGIAAGRALCIGMEPGTPDMVVSSGLARSAEACYAVGDPDDYDTHGGGGGSKDRFDLLIADSAVVDDDSRDSLERLLVEGGVLVEYRSHDRFAGSMVDCFEKGLGGPPLNALVTAAAQAGEVQDETAADGRPSAAPRGFQSILNRRFGMASLPVPGRAGMPGFVERLLIYCEDVMCREGVRPAVLELTVYVKGERPVTMENGPSAGRGDVVRQQEDELRRLQEAIRWQESRKREFESAVEDERRVLEQARRDLDRLEAENRILTDRGPLVYARMAVDRYRRSKG